MWDNPSCIVQRIEFLCFDVQILSAMFYIQKSVLHLCGEIIASYDIQAQPEVQP